VAAIATALKAHLRFSAQLRESKQCFMKESSKVRKIVSWHIEVISHLPLRRKHTGYTRKQRETKDQADSEGRSSHS
jgi:hypothetical protein